MSLPPQYYWVALSLVKGIGAVRMRLLLDYFSDVQSAWEASASELEAAGLPPKTCEALLQLRASEVPGQTWERIQELGIQVLSWEDSAYPLRLSEIEHPPPVLYVRGSLLAEDQWAVAIVGTRRATAYGRQVTEEFAAALAQHGLTVISGLARGIDAIAHQSALRVGGRSLAVLGCGVDQIYPPEHAVLARQISEQGALLSEYPPGAAPEAANFPPRNRLIAGLALAVLVVEAGEKSGALITAAFAAEQGRALFAVPGSIYAVQSKGTNRLIQQGAQVALRVEDILQSLQLTRLDQQRLARATLPGNTTEGHLYTLLKQEPLHVDELCRLSGLPAEQIAATLTMMELKGLVRQVGRLHYIAVHDAGVDYLT